MHPCLLACTTPLPVCPFSICSYSNAPMKQIYICAGSDSGPEVYRTQFTYFGFRYVGITG
jgi:hypothetical protein